MRIATYSRTFSILKKYDKFAKKNFGQNFIIEYQIIDKIVDAAGVDKDTGVIEIGPGIGALTEGLLLKAKKVVAFEIDTSLLEVLDEELKEFDNLTVINQDFLKVDIDKVVDEYFSDCKRVIIVSNLPYYITTPILIKIFEESTKIESVTAMMQKEVGKRICAQKGGKEYNNLSILSTYYSDCSIVLQVSKNIFTPRPNVDSCVVKFILNKKNKDVKDEKLFLHVLRSSFAMRRKKLLNNLEEYGKDRVKDILNELGINENVRAEELDLSDFVNISNKLI